MAVQPMDHAGIVVQDLERAVGFFRALGLELLGEATVDDDVDTALERVRALGYDAVGTVEDHAGVYRLCCVRGPEGAIVELAQETHAALDDPVPD